MNLEAPASEGGGGDVSDVADVNDVGDVAKISSVNCFGHNGDGDRRIVLAERGRDDERGEGCVG